MTRPTRMLCCCLLCAALATGLGACSLGAHDAAPKRTWAFSPVEAAPATESAGRPLLAVRPLEASPIYRDPSFVYRMGPQRYHQDHYNEFVLPPGDLVTQALRQRLARGGRVAVVSPRSTLTPHYVLEGTLVHIYAERRPPAAVLELRLHLLRTQSGAPALLWHRTYRRRTALEEFGPEPAMAAWDTALEELLDEVADDLPDGQQ